jgi:hypothetical protein
MLNVLSGLTTGINQADLDAVKAERDELAAQYAEESKISEQWAITASRYQADLKEFAGSVDRLLALKTKYII